MPSVLVANLLTQQKYALTKLDSLFACALAEWGALQELVVERAKRQRVGD